MNILALDNHVYMTMTSSQRCLEININREASCFWSETVICLLFNVYIIVPFQVIFSIDYAAHTISCIPLYISRSTWMFRTKSGFTHKHVHTVRRLVFHTMCMEPFKFYVTQMSRGMRISAN